MITSNNIFGQEDFMKRLAEAIVAGKVSHAYIFSGEEGIGKGRVADLFAKELNCTTIKEAIRSGKEITSLEACGICPSCLQAASYNHPDIIYIDKEEGKQSISVTDMRLKLVDDVVIKPYVGPYKIYIIKNAQDMTKEAQNAILKTLEEPPEYAVIILLPTSADLLLDTIRSRCEIYEIPMILRENLRQYLEEECKQATFEDIEFAILFADGKIGKAMKILTDPEYGALKRNVMQAIVGIPEDKGSGVMKYVREAHKYEKTMMKEYFDILSLWYRDVLLFETTMDANTVTFKDQVSEIGKQSKLFSYEDLEEIEAAINKARERIEANVSFDITMEMLFITIKEKTIK